MADRGLEQGTAWLLRVNVVPVLAKLKASRVPSLPPCSLTLSPSLWPRLSSSSARHSATESSTMHISTTAPIPNLLSQNLRPYLLYTLHRLAESVGSQVEQKGSFFSPAMLGAPLAFRSTVARALLWFPQPRRNRHRRRAPAVAVPPLHSLSALWARLVSGRACGREPTTGHACEQAAPLGWAALAYTGWPSSQFRIYILYSSLFISQIVCHIVNFMSHI
jgi:hypothetical protein